MSSELLRPPTAATAAAAPSQQQHQLHSSHPIGQFNARPLAQQSGALPPLTSNGYVTHDAIIGKVSNSFPKSLQQLIFFNFFLSQS